MFAIPNLLMWQQKVSAHSLCFFPEGQLISYSKEMDVGYEKEKKCCW